MKAPQKNPTAKLRRELALLKAFVLDRYEQPTPVDVKASLETSCLRTRFDQPYIEAWALRGEDDVYVTRVMAASAAKATNQRVYATEIEALIALRNMVAREAAAELAMLDKKIAKGAQPAS